MKFCAKPTFNRALTNGEGEESEPLYRELTFLGVVTNPQLERRFSVLPRFARVEPLLATKSQTSSYLRESLVIIQANSHILHKAEPGSISKFFVLTDNEGLARSFHKLRSSSLAAHKELAGFF